jgi:hypothetical protein
MMDESLLRWLWPLCMFAANAVGYYLGLRHGRAAGYWQAMGERRQVEDARRRAGF